MKTSLVLTTAISSIALSSALFADVSLNLGHIEDNQPIGINFIADSDCYLSIVNDDTHQEAAFVTVAKIFYTQNHYITSQGSELPEVTATDFSNGYGTFYGLPAGNYHFEAQNGGHQSVYQQARFYDTPYRYGYTFEYFDAGDELQSLECFIGL